MENRKRKADLQLSADHEDDSGLNETKSSDVKSSEMAPPVATGGFSGYAKTNPFAAAIASSTNKSPFGNLPSSSFSSGQNSASRTMPPPLTLPSPKSPKANPFSSPSPAHNPFMTIVENNDDLWKSMASDKLSAEEAAKTSAFTENRSRKSPVFRSSFFGGNGHSTFGSVAASAASGGAAPSTVFGSTKSGSAFGSSSATASSSATTSIFGANSAATTAAADDGDEDGGEDDNDADDQDGSGSPSNANQASMKIISLPENVKLVTGEEDDECLLQTRAKLFRLNTHADELTTGGLMGGDATGISEPSKPTSGGSKTTVDVANVLAAVGNSSNSNKKAAPAREAEWVEVGIGPLKILQRKGGAHSGRLVMRREDKQGGLGTKLLLNARLDTFLTANRQNDKMVQLVCVNYIDAPLPGAGNSGPKIGTYLIKTKTSDEADDLYSIVHDFVRRAKEEAEQQPEPKPQPATVSAPGQKNGSGNSGAAAPAIPYLQNGGTASPRDGYSSEKESPVKCSAPQPLRSSSPALPE